MDQVHIAGQSDKAPATKGIDAWKYFQDSPTLRNQSMDYLQANC